MMVFIASGDIYYTIGIHLSGEWTLVEASYTCSSSSFKLQDSVLKYSVLRPWVRNRKRATPIGGPDNAGPIVLTVLLRIDT